jgi:hypothetical protein
MPTSNAFHGGRARATFARGRATDLSAGFTPMVSSNDTPVNVTPVNHYDDDDADIFFDACEVLGNDENDKSITSDVLSVPINVIREARCSDREICTHSFEIHCNS